MTPKACYIQAPFRNLSMHPLLRPLRAAALGAVALAAAPVLLAQSPEPANKQVKYVRDAQEYYTLTRQVYRTALAAVNGSERARMTGPWAVVLDLDETVLDNSTYELERATYGDGYADATWNAWVQRAEAGVVPGAIDFISGIRRLGGRVAYISNRAESGRSATIDNLRRLNLWAETDKLCLVTDSLYTKRVRRGEVVNGTGNCSWNNTPTPIVAFIGDQMGDFPGAGESDADAGKDDAFGRRYFILPNPMYGAWVTRVTRQR